MEKLIVVGGGLAGSEAAWQAAKQGVMVDLYEMRPLVPSGAHTTDLLAELVCSNSLGSNLPDRASGVLLQELRSLNSFIVACADQTSIPAGGALAVDRNAFAAMVTQKVMSHPLINVIRQEITTIPEQPTVIASGPLTSTALSQALSLLLNHEGLAFFDAIAPIITAESIDMRTAFRASRYGRGVENEGDYINCPLTQEEYAVFIKELGSGERIRIRSFEEAINNGVRAGMHTFFEGCLPVEILAARGFDSLAFGPMRPVGLVDPRTGSRPFAVVQLRQDNYAASLYNMVGFQTNLTFSEQRRIFRLIPGLENAQFERYGQMHRNTFIASPLFLNTTLQFKHRNDLFFAGQITGVEGYLGNAATGLLAGLNAVQVLKGKPTYNLPEETMLGALVNYITHADLLDFQPTKANFGILPELDPPVRGKRTRAVEFSKRAKIVLHQYLCEVGLNDDIPA
ncbi:MAG: methylenetetrahydrofolate--tRNA-(uracil(54)-C(5))-methyltransferase (FADH(2)-oxidizing) TrmFO [Anaerolineae bacterium]|nr:methylenetetrahydrofolate--tRNA-(uracil(54)-C(5))-methyltransferase (FADH(2)-oxidizing) TrmFO [Anaerolineae bacterium]